MSNRAANFILDLATTGAGTVEQTQRKTERGDLVALAVTLPLVAAQKGDYYCRVYLAVSGNTKTESQTELIGDYIYEGHTPSWHGRIPLVQDTRVVLEVWTDTATQVRLNGTIEENP